MDYQSALAKVKGLGSAKSGTEHWWMQRVTAAALVPLTFWLIGLLDLALNAPYQQTLAWLAAPLHTVAIMTWLILACYHAALGLQVVIEDYVGEAVKIIAIWVVNLTFFMLALAGVLALLRIVIAG